MAKSPILSFFYIVFVISALKAQTSDLNSYKIFIGDFNGDGNDDYITQRTGNWTSKGNTPVELLLSLSDGNFARCPLFEGFGLGESEFNLFVGDFNGDGKDDILKQEKGGLLTKNIVNVYLMFSDGSGNFTSYILPEKFQLSGDSTNLYIGDFNGDGIDDIFRQAKGMLVPQSGSASWASWVLFGTSGPDFFRTSILPLELELNGDKTNLYVGDFNGDGCDDILRQEKGSFAADGTNTANILLSQPDESFAKIVLLEEYNLSGDLTTLHIGDFNGDGQDDILRREKGEWAADSSNSSQLMLSLDQGIFEIISLDENFDLKGDTANVYTGDFNGDGKTDFLRQSIGTTVESLKSIEVFLSKGESFDKFKFTKDQYGEDLSDNDYAEAVSPTFYMGDFNGDGNDDILKSTGTDIRIYYSNGDGSFT